MKDAVATMGDILPDDAGGRDAVHVAVFSAVSEERLFPGQDVALGSLEGRDATVRSVGEHIGIVDPFVKQPVPAGARFWVYLYPRSITGLSHRWMHPAFEGNSGAAYSPPANKLASEQWLRNFCANADCPRYEIVLAEASKVADGNNPAWDDGYLHFNDYDAHGDIPPEFWDHVEVVLGRPIKGRKPSYFSCSC